MKDYEEIKVDFLNRTDMQVLRRSCSALSDIRSRLVTLSKRLCDEAIAIAAEGWVHDTYPSTTLSVELLRENAETIAEAIVESGNDDLGAIAVGFWVDEPDYSINSIACHIEGHPYDILRAHEALFGGKNPNEESEKDDSEDAEKESFMEAVRDYDEDENYAVRCILMEEAFVRDACKMIDLENGCCEIQSEYDERGDMLRFDTQRFDREYIRVWNALIEKVTMSAEDCLSILKALKRDIPLDGSIRKEAVDALKEWRNPYAYQRDFMSYVYKKLGDAVR